MFDRKYEKTIVYDYLLTYYTLTSQIFLETQLWKEKL